MFLYTSQQVGSTYGGFGATTQATSTISFCEVFPNSIKGLLSELKDHVESAVALKGSLQSYTLSGSLSDVSGIEGMSLDELDVAAQEISTQISALQSQIDGVNEQLASNSQIWNDINSELNAAAAVLFQIGGYMTSLDSNCLEIKDEQFFSDLQNSLNQSGVLSESLNASLNGVIHYLSSIHDIGLPFASVVTSDVYGQLELSNRAFQQPLPFLIAFNQPAGNISSELTSTYESLNTEMNGLKESATSGISNLQSQLQLISQTRDQQLEALEKARLEALEQAKKEEERLALEKKEKQEAEDKAKAEENAKAEETSPTGEAAPENINKEDPKAPATNPVEPEIGEELTTPKDVPQQEVPQETPKAEDTASSSPPAATQAPSNPQQVKGGE
ncbi:hypothetical protein [Paenibacillus sp.]|uniref:hypothetical protein n=1 Tax=Paenibacillus sp. TaxID=58172 RepID=UPI0028A6A8E5|nr:hypothetical protein [Paenibacillus sp.]